MANLSLLGYNPREHFTGRAPLEAAASGIESGPTIGPSAATSSPSRAGPDVRVYGRAYFHARRPPPCWKPSNSRLGSDRLQFYPGVSYRNLLVVRGGGQPAPFSPQTLAHPAP